MSQASQVTVEPVDAAPTATIEEDDFRYFEEPEEIDDSHSEQEEEAMTVEPPLVRVATCGSTISHLKHDYRWVKFRIFVLKCYQVWYLFTGKLN